MYYMKSTKFYRNNDESNVCNRMINILLNKLSRNTKYHITNVYENKSIMLQSFEEKKYHVTKVWKKATEAYQVVQNFMN